MLIYQMKVGIHIIFMFIQSNLIKCHDLWFMSPGPLWVIVEYAKFGNLRDFLESSRDGINGYGRFREPSDPSWYTTTPGGSTINRKSLISYAFQIARGMEFLSNHKVSFLCLFSVCLCYIKSY